MTSTTSYTTTTPLYGGAIVCDIPTSWKDVSDMRQVPDHQCVYLGPTLQEEPSLVIEILDHQGSVSNDNAAKYFFDDLAEANGCSSTTTTSSNSFVTIPATTTTTLLKNNNKQENHSTMCFLGIGMQRVAKGRDVDMAGNPRILPIINVQIELAVLRLPQVQTDLLITVSRTIKAGDATTTQQQPQLSEEFQRILATFEIRDWSLFGATP
mmetsp:Transcript_3372/g.5540  ORF Transcript_3372/g.5540 Transcript_3372/m.5540 type:complete len:210 (+) Transcript_3372:56-685(+)|eukprot:CAMPEP_0119015994 /NCGR_PEP_ID=MMETSP1176-20130426/11759_1 /TAXON_ID=265551 /ORGANISM="Synedropsis recta cf, Strain CCMP1620" /LENGTH=209 /DNA_ID=CAMNT_0006969319 /DNA_START=56 /DNA_END=685 /DNA_ORIENTATION=+